MIQLRIRTEYSFGKTYAPIGKVIAHLKSIGCSAAGIVDIDSTWGHVKWAKACVDVGIKPLLGVDICVSDNDDYAPRMWFLARDSEGLKELYHISSLAHRQKIRTKRGLVPRLYRSDILCTTPAVIKFAGDILDGEFLHKVGAIIDLDGSSAIVDARKANISATKSLPLVEVSDNWFIKDGEIGEFEIIGGLKKPTKQYIREDLKLQDAAATIAEGISSDVLNTAPMIRVEGALEDICRKGIEYRKLDWNDEYEQRLRYELELIKSKDFESYFLIVSDMTQYAKEHMLVGPSRGSAAGSLVCYLSRITEIDPIKANLYFERFIDVSRSDLPDIDLDFPDKKRHIVFEYMANKYGKENTSHIGTVSVYRPKSALIATCKALGIPASVSAPVKVAMIERSSADARATSCLLDTLTGTEQGREFLSMYPSAIISANLEGHATHTGVHAAGLLICNDAIENYATVTDGGIAQIDKLDAEKLGLLKIDVLGLRTLTILEEACVGVNWYDLKYDDALAIQIFNSRRFCGIFQFEGQAMRSVADAISFKGINEIDAVTALARPGPFAGGVTAKYIERANGKKFDHIHNAVMEYMGETYGLPIYQEQTLAIVKNIGRFDWKETTSIRKAMSKSLGVEFFDKLWPRFRDGAATHGIDEGKAKSIWLMINAMGSWQMNKAHTFSYAVVSYWTAYLKAHFPIEFAAATLNNAPDEDASINLLRELTREGIKFKAFDIEESDVNWSAKNGALIGGFTTLKGIGEIKARKLVEARNSGRLTKKQIEFLNNAPSPYYDIFPIRTKFGHIYDNPKACGVAARKIWMVEEIIEGMDHGVEVVVIGQLILKNPRNANEEAEIKKRGGKIETGQLEYLDIRIQDDTGIIGGRIGRKDYLEIGVKLVREVPVGAYIMVRAKLFNGIRYLFISKWKAM